MVKSLESVDQDVEHKGETADMEKTYFNIVWSCNHKDKMRYLANDDRRFSIMDITEDALMDKEMIDKITGEKVVFSKQVIDSLCHDQNILLELAEFILNGDPDFSLAETPFKGGANECEIRRSSRPIWCQELLDCLTDIKWDSPGGTPHKIGYEEINKCTDPDFTYEIPSCTIERVIDSVTKSRRSVTISWNMLKEEFRKYDHREVYIYQEPFGPRRYGIRIRHSDHDKILEKMDKLEVDFRSKDV